MIKLPNEGNEYTRLGVKLLLPQSGSETVRELVSLERDIPGRRASSIFA